MTTKEICTAGRWRPITEQEKDEIVASTNAAYVRAYSCARVPFLVVEWDALFERTIAAMGVAFARDEFCVWEPAL